MTEGQFFWFVATWLVSAFILTTYVFRHEARGHRKATLFDWLMVVCPVVNVGVAVAVLIIMVNDLDP